MVYSYGGAQQNGALNLSQTGAPTYGSTAPHASPYGANPLGGWQQQPATFAPWQQQQQPPPPPTEMQMLDALLQAQNPIHRFISDGGLGALVTLLSTATSLSVMSILKDATFVIDEDEGVMKMDTSSLPDAIKTLSAENVNMLIGNMLNASQQKMAEAEANRQGIIAMSQQSALGGALDAALANEGLMNKTTDLFGRVIGNAVGTR